MRLEQLACRHLKTGPWPGGLRITVEEPGAGPSGVGDECSASQGHLSENLPRSASSTFPRMRCLEPLQSFARSSVARSPAKLAFQAFDLSFWGRPGAPLARSSIPKICRIAAHDSSGTGPVCAKLYRPPEDSPLGVVRTARACTNSSAPIPPRSEEVIRCSSLAATGMSGQLSQRWQPRVVISYGAPNRRG